MNLPSGDTLIGLAKLGICAALFLGAIKVGQTLLDLLLIFLSF